MSLEDRDLAAEIAELEVRQFRAPAERRPRIVRHLAWFRELQKRRAATTPVDIDRAFLRRVVESTMHGPGGRGVRGSCDTDCVKCEAERRLDHPKPHHAGRQAIPVINPTDTPELPSGSFVLGFTVGTGGGAGMAKSGDPGWQSRVHAAADKIDRGANVVATPPDEEHPLGQVSVTPRRIAVELVLDKLERFAKRSAANASRQHWVAEKDGNSGICSVVSSDAVEPEDMICETITEADADHVVAAQPAAILALIATVREMIPLVKDWASKERAEAAQIGWTVDSDFETILNRALTVEAP